MWQEPEDAAAWAEAPQSAADELAAHGTAPPFISESALPVTTPQTAAPNLLTSTRGPIPLDIFGEVDEPEDDTLQPLDAWQLPVQAGMSGQPQTSASAEVPPEGAAHHHLSPAGAHAAHWVSYLKGDITIFCCCIAEAEAEDDFDFGDFEEAGVSEPSPATMDSAASPSVQQPPVQASPPPPVVPSSSSSSSSHQPQSTASAAPPGRPALAPGATINFSVYRQMHQEQAARIAAPLIAMDDEGEGEGAVGGSGAGIGGGADSAASPMAVWLQLLQVCSSSHDCRSWM